MDSASGTDWLGRVRPGALRVTYVRSRGPGGQNVNKRSTKAELRVALADIDLPPDAAERLARLARSRLTGDAEIVITSDVGRSQTENRAACEDVLSRLIARAMTPPTPRRPTRPTKGSRERRLASKQARARTKRDRRAGDWE